MFPASLCSMLNGLKTTSRFYQGLSSHWKECSNKVWSFQYLINLHPTALILFQHSIYIDLKLRNSSDCGNISSHCDPIPISCVCSLTMLLFEARNTSRFPFVADLWRRVDQCVAAVYGRHWGQCWVVALRETRQLLSVWEFWLDFLTMFVM